MSPESIVAVRSDARTDRITVRTRIPCPAGTGKVVRGRRIGEWIEDWTLIRSRVSSGGAPPGPGPAGGWLVDGMHHVAIHLERAA